MESEPAGIPVGMRDPPKELSDTVAVSSVGEVDCSYFCVAVL